VESEIEDGRTAPSRTIATCHQVPTRRDQNADVFRFMAAGPISNARGRGQCARCTGIMINFASTIAPRDLCRVVLRREGRCGICVADFTVSSSCRNLLHQSPFGHKDLVRTTFKSGIVALCSSAAAALCALMVEFGMLGPILGLGLACASATICWLVSMVVTEHPLLPRLQLAATGFFYTPRLKFADRAKRGSTGVAGKGIFPYSNDVKMLPSEY
jgi:hypothetical protein